jgi:hypothetical protein
MLVSCLSDSSAKNMEATSSTETSVVIQESTRRYVPEDKTLRL